MTTDRETAAAIIGIGRTLAYDLVRRDAFPVRLLRLGRRVIITNGELLRYQLDQVERSERGSN